MRHLFRLLDAVAIRYLEYRYARSAPKSKSTTTTAKSRVKSVAALLKEWRELGRRSSLDYHQEDPIYGDDHKPLDFQGMKDELRHARTMMFAALQSGTYFMRKWDEANPRPTKPTRGREETTSCP